MPLYDFRCPICQVSEEYLVRDSDEVVACVRCDQEMARQFPRVAGIRMGDVPRGTLSGGDLYDYDRADMHASASYATEASYDVLRQSGMDRDRARSTAKEAGPSMITAGERLMRNQERAGQR